MFACLPLHEKVYALLGAQSQKTSARSGEILGMRKELRLGVRLDWLARLGVDIKAETRKY